MPFEAVDTPLEWVNVIQHFVEDNSHCPDVTLYGVAGCLSKCEVYLWSHRVRGPATATLHLELASKTFGKAEIGNFELGVLDEYVLELKIAMDDLLGLQDIHTAYQLFEIFERHL